MLQLRCNAPAFGGTKADVTHGNCATAAFATTFSAQPPERNRRVCAVPVAPSDTVDQVRQYADDVVCGHGSTVAEIDAGMMFYLGSRGIPKPDARAMLIESFVGEAIDKLADGQVRDGMMRLARDWLMR